MSNEIDKIIEGLAGVSVIEHLPREDQEYDAQQILQGEEWGVVSRRVGDWLDQYQMEAACEDGEAVANERDYL